MPYPKKKPEDKFDIVFVLKLRPSDKHLLNRLATRFGMTKSEFIRKKIITEAKKEGLAWP